MKLLRLTYVIAGVGFILIIISIMLSYRNNDFADLVGDTSTIVSVVLGLISIVYTYASGKDTLIYLDKMKEELHGMKHQYESFVNEIDQKLVEDNFDENNIEDVENYNMFNKKS